MGPAMMADFMAAAHHLGAGFGIGFDGKAGDKPGGGYLLSRQQRQNARGPDDAELAARDRRGCRHATGDMPRHHIKIERQTNNVLCHAKTYLNVKNAGIDCAVSWVPAQCTYCRARKSSSTALNASPCSILTRCPAPLMTASSAPGIWRCISLPMLGGVSRSSAP